MRSFKETKQIYMKEFRESWVFWVGAFFGLLEVVSMQSEYVRAIVGEKWAPYVMILAFYIARFRPSKVLPPKDAE
jgi:hypothetical protein